MYICTHSHKCIYTFVYHKYRASALKGKYFSCEAQHVYINIFCSHFLVAFRVEYKQEF